MPISYKYNIEFNRIETKITGVLSSEEIAKYFQSLKEDVNLSANFLEVVDFNEADDLILRYSDLTRLKILYGDLLSLGHRVTVFCAYSDSSQGMLNMMMPLFHTMKINVMVCKDEHEFEASMNLLFKQSD